MEHIIWSNTNLNVEDWIDGYKEYLEINDREVPAEIDESDLYDWMVEANWEYLNDAKGNLNVQTEGQIIAIADLGFWYGRCKGYDLLSKNVNSCLKIYDSCDYAEFYFDRNDLKSTQSHHDGTHYITYREFKPNMSVSQIDNFCDKIYNGTVTQRDITRYTRSLRPYVKKVYGW